MPTMASRRRFLVASSRIVPMASEWECWWLGSPPTLGDAPTGLLFLDPQNHNNPRELLQWARKSLFRDAKFSNPGARIINEAVVRAFAMIISVSLPDELVGDMDAL